MYRPEVIDWVLQVPRMKARVLLGEKVSLRLRSPP